MTIADIFKRPGLWLGTGFSTIDEFHIFMCTMGIHQVEGWKLPKEEGIALRVFDEFVCRHLHGHFKGCKWRYDLLSEHGDHELAIKAAMILFLELAKMLREKGTDQVREVMELVPSLEHINPNGRPERLERLIAEAISLHSN